MKTAEFLNKLAVHVSLICGIAILVIQVLDWYNPYMDFMGHSMFLLYALCAGSLYLGLCRILGGKRRKKNGSGRYGNKGGKYKD